MTRELDHDALYYSYIEQDVLSRLEEYLDEWREAAELALVDYNKEVLEPTGITMPVAKWSDERCENFIRWMESKTEDTYQWREFLEHQWVNYLDGYWENQANLKADYDRDMAGDR